MATVAINDTIPDGTLSYFDKEGELKSVSIHSLIAGKKVVLFGVPGAFTPTCSCKHVPGYIEKAAELKAAGVEEVICMTVNDAFVLREWAKTFTENEDNVLFLADGSATYAKALGLELDLSEHGLGVRSKRFALLVDDLKVKVANIEEGPELKISGVDLILEGLKA